MPVHQVVAHSHEDLALDCCSPRLWMNWSWRQWKKIVSFW